MLIIRWASRWRFAVGARDEIIEQLNYRAFLALRSMPVGDEGADRLGFGRELAALMASKETQISGFLAGLGNRHQKMHGHPAPWTCSAHAWLGATHRTNANMKDR